MGNRRTSLSRDLRKVLGLLVPAEFDANIVSGLFMERLARMPVVCDETVGGECFLVLAVIASPIAFLNRCAIDKYLRML